MTRPHNLTPFDVRFAWYVVRGNGCWSWRGGRTKHGYGEIQHRGEKLMAHRVSYEKYVGPIPTGMLVLHRCDNPPCTNPEHLFLGTHVDNGRDMMQKGRGRGQFRRQECCARGHPFTTANTRVKKDGARRCRICTRATDRARLLRSGRVHNPRGPYRTKELSHG